MRILLLTHSFNSLSQRLWLELTAAGHALSVEFDINDVATAQAVALWRPELILAPYLKRPIAEAVWRHTPCLIVHPGPPGDRGPSALDWAIQQQRQHWGVTVLQAVAELDAGPVWARRDCPLRAAAKSSVYRNEITEAAVAAVFDALARIAAGLGPLLPANLGRESAHPPIRQRDRQIDWQRDDSRTVLAKLHAADGQPGVRERLGATTLWLHDAAPAPGLNGTPGAWLGHAGASLARATVDGAVWIGHLQIDDAESGCRIKLPAADAWRRSGLALPPAIAADGAPNRVDYRVEHGVGVLRFPFLNGALSVDRCTDLLAAIDAAARGPERAIVLLGGPDFWCNGMDLSSIEAAASPAEASWANINAINDVCRALIELCDKWVIAALCGNAGAGGVFLALCADEVLVRHGVVLNPHYRNMGNLHGSEYSTYLLPRRLGHERAEAMLASRLPIGAAEAVTLGLCDRSLPGDPEQFAAAAIAHARAVLADADLAERLQAKAAARAADEAIRPLASYREAELARMRENFFGFDTSYHIARFDFVTRTPHSRTPLHLARHRRQGRVVAGGS
jgi:putative two-component system protein, hydrogenase maturation factor HypX/HoxX